jgi:hypothetical protein
VARTGNGRQATSSIAQPRALPDDTVTIGIYTFEDTSSASFEFSSPQITSN